VNIPGSVLAPASTGPDRVALRGPAGKRRKEITYGRLARDAERFALGLRARGVEPGDRVLCVADNSPRWIVADLGIMLAGAVSVHRGADSNREEVEYIAGHSRPAAVLLGTHRLVEKLGEAVRGGETCALLSGEAEGGRAALEQAYFEVGLRADAAASTSYAWGSIRGLVFNLRSSGLDAEADRFEALIPGV